MHLDARSVRRIVDEVWGLVLHASTETCGDGHRAVGDRALVGSVRMSGAWEGGVAVRCSLPFARVIASRIYDLDGAEPSEGDIHQALCEIVNLIGGNVKGLVTGCAAMSKPSVIDAGDSPVAQLEGGGAASTTWLSSLGHPFAVTVTLRARTTP